MVPQRHHSKRQLARQDLPVIVEHRALGAVLVEHEFEAALVLQDRLLRGCVDDAGRAAQAEENGVGAPQHIHTIHRISIPRDIRKEIVAGVVSAGKAAHAVVAVRILEQILFLIGGLLDTAGIIAARSTDFGIHRVAEQRPVVDRTEVVHQFLGHYRDG